MLLWHRQAVVLQGEDVAFDGLADVGDGGLAVFALGDAAGKTRTLGDPETVFARINDDLSHGRRITVASESSTPMMVDPHGEILADAGGA